MTRPENPDRTDVHRTGGHDPDRTAVVTDPNRRPPAAEHGTQSLEMSDDAAPPHPPRAEPPSVEPDGPTDELSARQRGADGADTVAETGERTQHYEPPTQQMPVPEDPGPVGAPPWQRGGTSAAPYEAPNGIVPGLDVGQPQHSGVHGGPVPGGDVPRAPDNGPAYAFSSSPPPGERESPTGYVEPIREPVAPDPAPAANPEFGGPTMRIHQPPPPEQTGARPSSPPQGGSTRVRSTGGRVQRRASLQLRRLEPWSVLKLSLVLSVAGFLAWMVAVGVLYGVLEGMGVWDQLNGTYSDLTSGSDPAGDDLISATRVFSVAAVVGAVNILLLTAMNTVGSFIYNVSADLAGGVEITLSERD